MIDGKTNFKAMIAKALLDKDIDPSNEVVQRAMDVTWDVGIGAIADPHVQLTEAGVDADLAVVIATLMAVGLGEEPDSVTAANFLQGIQVGIHLGQEAMSP